MLAKPTGSVAPLKHHRVRRFGKITALIVGGGIAGFLLGRLAYAPNSVTNASGWFTFVFDETARRNNLTFEEFLSSDAPVPEVADHAGEHRRPIPLEELFQPNTAGPEVADGAGEHREQSSFAIAEVSGKGKFVKLGRPTAYGGPQIQVGYIIDITVERVEHPDRGSREPTGNQSAIYFIVTLLDGDGFEVGTLQSAIHHVEPSKASRLQGTSERGLYPWEADLVDAMAVTVFID